MSSPSTKEVSLVYVYQGGLYVNLTSRCPTACAFCIKFSWKYQYRGHNLKLPGEPAMDQILVAAGEDLSQHDEVVFCGYGESTYRLPEMRTLTAAFRARGAKRVRLNTVGLGNLINGRDIAPELTFLDAVSISLNTVDPVKYVEIMHPLPEFRGKALDSVLDFIASCARHVPDTTVTTVEMPGLDADGVRRAAETRGAKFRLRPYLEEDPGA